ncbi:AhpC/TSA family protein [Zalerion maritima]|uniref:AhpC/TSA family protein n=1 Tax=Zalerion maritima TaxID=339359 RepID=A0AAD5WT88_9PEZI|nr:AhpC/TSA family protein [Zalerion maritima]
MAFRLPIKTGMAMGRTAGAASIRNFHAAIPTFVKAGDALPNKAVLVEDSPGNKVNLAEELKGKKGLIIGVPAAFSPGCSNSHVPSYIKHPELKDAGDVFLVSVNDAFVMKAWGESLGAGKAGIRVLGDPTAEFTKELDLDFDGSAIFGGPRGKRYALVIEDGKVKSAHVEPDNTGTNVSMADKVLG